MSNGTRPAILLGDLLSREGPHQELAERFLAGACLRCGSFRVDQRLDRSDSQCDDCSSLDHS
jgi:hypothetical protein